MASGSGSHGRRSGSSIPSAQALRSMASGSGSHGCSSSSGSSSRARATEDPLVGDATRLASQLNNPTLEALPAVDLVAHLNQYRRTEDFVDAGLVFAAREQQADQLIREIRAREYNAVEAEARIRQATETEAALRAKIHSLQRRATETEAALRAKIHSLQLSTMTLISAISGAADAGLPQPATGPSHEPPVSPRQFITKNTDAMGCSHDATDVQQTMNTWGEVGSGDVPVKPGYIGAMWSRPAPHLVVAPPMRHEALCRAMPQVAAAPLPPGILIDDDDKSRIPKAEDLVHVADDAGAHTVVPTGSSKKARRQKRVSFYNEVFKSEMEKRKLIAGNEENEDGLKKKAAEAASKALYDRCFSHAPYLPAQLGSQTVKEDSGEEA